MHLSTIILPLLAGNAIAAAVLPRADSSISLSPVSELNGGIIKRQTAVAVDAPPQPDDPDPEDGGGEDDGSPEGELLGDLKNGITTPIGQSVANILQGKESGMSQKIGTAPTTDAACKKDRCCIWYNISAELTTVFRGRTGRCNDMARAAVRLGFHDAGTWSKSKAAAGQDFGGADGSFVLFGEISRQENRGLEKINDKIAKLQKKYGVGMGDLIQYAANHATVTCPLGPRVRTYVGRKDATRASLDGLLPDVRAPAADLVALFQDKTIGAHELTALVGAHSTSKQFFVDPTQAGAPQDSTPAVWDVAFYNETLQAKPKKKVFRFQSDIALSQYPATADEWQRFVGDQKHWNKDYSVAYVRLSLLGVNNINKLAECTHTLPAAQPSFPGSGEEGFLEAV